MFCLPLRTKDKSMMTQVSELFFWLYYPSLFSSCNTIPPNSGCNVLDSKIFKRENSPLSIYWTTVSFAVLLTDDGIIKCEKNHLSAHLFFFASSSMPASVRRYYYWFLICQCTAVGGRRRVPYEVSKAHAEHRNLGRWTDKWRSTIRIMSWTTYIIIGTERNET